MPNADDWRELAYSNRARLDSLEPEMQRVRERLHGLESEVTAVTYLGKRLEQLATEMHELGEKIERLSRRAVERPTSAGWSAAAGWLTVAVSIVALVIALLHA